MMPTVPRTPPPRALCRPEFEMGWQRKAMSCVLAAVLTCSPLAAPAKTLDLSTPLSALQQQEQTVEDLFSRATPSVVYITTFVERTDRVTMNAVEVPAGTGSGFVWDDEGHST